MKVEHMDSDKKRKRDPVDIVKNIEQNRKQLLKPALDSYLSPTEVLVNKEINRYELKQRQKVAEIKKMSNPVQNTVSKEKK